jgi:hypothetical protein
MKKIRKNRGRITYLYHLQTLGSSSSFIFAPVRPEQGIKCISEKNSTYKI